MNKFTIKNVTFTRGDINAEFNGVQINLSEAEITLIKDLYLEGQGRNPLACIKYIRAIKGTSLLETKNICEAVALVEGEF